MDWSHSTVLLSVAWAVSVNLMLAMYRVPMDSAVDPRFWSRRFGSGSKAVLIVRCHEHAGLNENRSCLPQVRFHDRHSQGYRVEALSVWFEVGLDFPFQRARHRAKVGLLPNFHVEPPLHCDGWPDVALADPICLRDGKYLWVRLGR